MSNRGVWVKVGRRAETVREARGGGGEAKLWSGLAYRSHPGSNPLERRRRGMELHGKPVLLFREQTFMEVKRYIVNLTSSSRLNLACHS